MNTYHKNKDVIAVIGGQWGSESKGKHVQDICLRNKNIQSAVRTGAPNAGHTLKWDDEYVAMKILPTAWAASNVKKLYIGAGAQIDLDTLDAETKIVQGARGAEVDIHIDSMAMIQEDFDAECEKHMSGSIGSTAKGCGAALIRRITRDASKMAFHSEGVDTAEMINKDIDEGRGVLFEGTQGAHLSLYHGEWPYVTSRETNAANWLAEAGVSPLVLSEVHMVCRTFPIRVAGDSGYLPNEIGWDYFFEELGLSAGIIRDFRNCVEDKFDELEMHPDERGELMRNIVNNVCKEMEQQHGKDWKPFADIMEFTTVTKLPRRIGKFDMDTFERSVMLNRPTHVSLEFCNYLTAKEYGMETIPPLLPLLSPVGDKGDILHGQMGLKELDTLTRSHPPLRKIYDLVVQMNEVLKKWNAGRVSKLGIAKDSSIFLTH